MYTQVVTCQRIVFEWEWIKDTIKKQKNRTKQEPSNQVTKSKQPHRLGMISLKETTIGLRGPTNQTNHLAPKTLVTSTRSQS